jgi:ubiquitin-like-conjugating enzyme ATG3
MRRESGHPSKRKDHLPPNKQYLVTRRVPCRHRPKALEREALNADEEIITSEADGDEPWVATHSHHQPRTEICDTGIPDIDMEDAGMPDDEIRDMDIDDIPGLEDMQMPSDDESLDETRQKRYAGRYQD